MKRWEMNRRTFLKGMGISIALPVLDAMVPSMARAATPGAPRFAAIYCPTGSYGGGWDPSKNGMAKNGVQGKDRYFAAAPTSEWGGTAWRPRTAGPLPATLPPITAALESVKQNITIVSGLSHPINAHSAIVVWLSGDKQFTELPNYSYVPTTTLDQEIANQFGYTPGSTIVFCPQAGGDPYLGFMSYNAKLGNARACPKTTDAKKKFDQLFGSCDPNTMNQLTAAQKNNQSVLDYVADSIASVQSRLGKDDKVRLDAYLTNVRELEKKLTVVGPNVSCPPLPASDPMNASGPLVQLAQDQLMVDVMALAMASDVMPICTLMLDNEAQGSTDYGPRIGYANDFIGVNGTLTGFKTSTTDWHFDVSHHGNELERVEQVIAMNRYHLRYFGRLIKKLGSMPVEPNGYTPLDNSLLLTGIPLSDGNDHLNANIPTVLAGGKKFGLKTNQHVALTMNSDIGDFNYTLLKAMGLNISNFNGFNKILPGIFG